MPPPHILEMQDLYSRRHQKDTARLRSYDQIMKQIMNKVRSHAALPTHPTEILYEVPSFLMGVPKIDMQDAIVYLTYQLRTGGFEVRFTWPNLLYISWKHYEREYLMQSSPIFQSMVQSASHVMNKADPKKPTLLKPARTEKKKVKFSVGFGAGAGIGSSAGSGAGTGGAGAGGARVIPAALEYQPPLEFFKAIEAPKPSSAFIDITKF